MKYFYNKLCEIVIARVDDKLPTNVLDLNIPTMIRHINYWNKTKITQPISIAYFAGFKEISKEEANSICKQKYIEELKQNKAIRENAKNPF